jgi:transposase InsO family protein/predicted aspartyl protease
MDLKLGVVVVLATQATNLNNSSQVTSTSISARTSRSNTRGSFLSSSSTVRTTSKEEIDTSIRATRQPVFLPQQPIRIVKQR